MTLCNRSITMIENCHQSCNSTERCNTVVNHMLAHIIVKGKYIQVKGLRYGFPFSRNNLGSWGGGVYCIPRLP